MVLPGVDIVRITRGSIKRLSVEAQFTDKNNYRFKLKLMLIQQIQILNIKKITITLKS